MQIPLKLQANRTSRDPLAPSYPTELQRTTSLAIKDRPTFARKWSAQLIKNFVAAKKQGAGWVQLPG